MRKRLFFIAAATIGLAACSSESSTAPSRLQPGAALRDDLTCRSGYHVATYADGTQYCAPDAVSAASPTSAP